MVAAQVNATIDIVFRFIDAAGLATGPVQAFIDDGAGDQDLPAIAAFLQHRPGRLSGQRRRQRRHRREAL